jgi:hypothetical protein
MSEIRFSDGMTIQTGGEYRVIEKSDGLYVVGHGICVPVNSYQEGNQMIADLMTTCARGVEEL